MTGEHSDNVALVSHAVDQGITLLDNADVYGLDWGGTHFGACEEALGRVFADNPRLRDATVLATKGGIVPGVPYNSSPDYIISACEASLRRLGVDVIDLYQIHRPDMFTHPEVLADAFSQLFERGLVRTFGVSNYTVPQTRALLRYVTVPFVTTQPEFSVVQLDALRDGTLDLCMELQLTPMAWSPLAGGRVASGNIPSTLLFTLRDIAQEHNTTPECIAIAFVLSHPSRPIALLGTQQPERLATLTRALNITLSRTEIYRIVQASDGTPLP